MIYDLFSLQGCQDKHFICNSRTGRWGLAREINEEIADALSNPFPHQPFCGTQMIVMNISNICNLKCIYCFAEGLKDKKMSIETGRKTIDRVFELPENSRNLVFHGKEPMTNYELIVDLINYAKQLGTINFKMQSNGTLFDDPSIEFLVRNEIGIGISLDGLPRHQNKARSYLNRGGSYEEVVKNLEKIRKAQKGISVIAVVSRHNVFDLEEIADHFENIGIDSIFFNPAYPKTNNNDFCPNQEVLIKQMTSLFDKKIAKILAGRSGIEIGNLKDVLRTFFSPKITTNCIRCNGTMIHPLIGIDIDGSIYPCDLFWGMEDYKIGNIFDMRLEDSFNHPRNFRTYRTIDNIPSCLSCRWQKFCGGECPGSSVRHSQTIAKRGYYCEYRKAILEYAAQKIPFLHEKRILGKLLGIQ